MDHLKAINQKARRIEEHVGAPEPVTPAAPSPAENGDASPKATAADPADLDVVGLESRSGPHIPLGCSLVFAPGWEVDSTGGTAGLCQPVERDLFDCHLACFWPAHVPDQLNHAPDWTGKCASAQKDWRKIDLIFP
ncbi:MAG: quinohemoprotein amine dehydrogenase [Gemmatimonadetes bacterium]|nr:quinohemoprotein amine dehydrogenase [Gemmatimonadota bacterium]MYK66910.1 quinohemoprotein amine dehydrogenase [Gemmatimonadota bacterium]